MAKNKVINLIMRLKGAKQTEGKVKGVDKSLGKLAKTAGAVAAGYLSIQSAAKVWDAAKLGAQAELVEKKFRSLIDQPDELLARMKKASAGTISEFDLMKKANTAALLGLPLERFDDMLKVARNAAQATGESMDFMLNSIVTGIGRQSKLMIDNLGIIVSVGDANEVYASQLGKASSELTDFEKKQAFANAVLKSGLENVEKSGGVAASSADSYDAFTASAENLGVAIGEKLNPLISSLADDLTTATNAVIKILEPVKELTLDEQWEKSSEAVKQYQDELIHLEIQKRLGLEVDSAQLEMTKLLLEAEQKRRDGVFLAIQATEDWAQKEFELSDIRRTNIDVAIEEMEVVKDLNDTISSSAFSLDNFSTRMNLAATNAVFAASSITSTTNAMRAAEGAAKNAAAAFVSAEIQKAVAKWISSMLQSSGAAAWLTAPIALAGGAAFGSLMGSAIQRFATGGDFVTSGPQTIIVGDNPGGRERVQVTPLSSPNVDGPKGITLNFNAPVTNADFVRDVIAPELEKAVSLA